MRKVQVVQIIMSEYNYTERYISKEGEGHNKILIVTGVSGSGKDYLLSQLQKEGTIPPSIRIVSFGEELYDYLHVAYPEIKTRDDIRRLLSHEQVRAGVLGVVERLIQNQPATVNTHIVFRQKESLVVNPDVDKKLHPLGYLYVWSDPGQVSQWRLQDKTRVRPLETIEDIALHQDIAKEVVAALARYTGAKMLTLNNRDDNVKQNITTMQEEMKMLAI